MQKREALKKRTSLETDIEIYIHLDGQQQINLDLSIPFFPHLLRSMAFYAEWDLKVKACGDVEVDYHHLVEDLGIVLGEAFRTALGEIKNIQRYSTQFIPMDDALSMVSIDVGGRPFLYYDVPIGTKKVGDFEVDLIEEFLRAFTNNARITLHSKAWWGKNGHHILEALFKALGKALKEAVIFSDQTIPSTKGII
ncbi:MAG: imidazoleglycerol-phosphate dehydratase HisB [Candidatus Atribacteria bacterium]|nr:imidazoleglycerol-phosphate dehydratase HisB [Candidatus Atribacteria bacterium]